MQPFFGLLILAALASGTSDAQPGSAPSDAVEIFHCSFARDWDANFDDWPDGWQRQRGAEYPHYVKIGIEADATASQERCLTIGLDGGAAAVHSPELQVSPNFSYVLHCRVKSAGLKHDRVFVTIDFLDEDGNWLESATSEPMENTSSWIDVQVGPVSPVSDRVRKAVLSLSVRPLGKRSDIVGSVSLDEVGLGRLPRMEVGTDSSFNVYTDPDEIVVTCELSGIRDRSPDILFELLDFSGQILDSHRTQLAGRAIEEALIDPSAVTSQAAAKPAGYEGETTWQPPIADYGHYRVRVTMLVNNDVMNQKTISMAVVPPLPNPPQGPFGWTLHRGDSPLSFAQLTELLPLTAINWVKMPVWFRADDDSRGDQLVMFTEQLAASDIEMVGILDAPPPGTELHKRMGQSVSIADILSLDPSNWRDSLDAVMTRLSLRIRWWQLGGDHDTGFVGYPGLIRKLHDVREQLFRFGQEVRMGLSWRWIYQHDIHPLAPWNFQQFFSSPALTGDEIGAYLTATAGGVRDRWVLVEPLPRDQYSADDRVRDLVSQMLAAKIHGADAIFVPQPFSTEVGLMNDDGTPGELLLPWRTTAALLSNAEFLGSIHMPAGSQNRIFAKKDGDVVMAIWNDVVDEEVIYLGEAVRALDIWGRETTPANREHRSVIPVGPLPTFVTGVSKPVALWRMALKFDDERIPSVFGRSHRNGIRVMNSFEQGGGGTMTIEPPTGWRITPARIDFKAARGEKIEKRFEVTLPQDASSGPQPVLVEVDLLADRHYHFTVYRRLTVGLGHLNVEISTHLDSDGTLVVEQQMTNSSSTTPDFKCLLYAPGRRAQRSQVYRLGGSADIKIYRYAQGRELIGKELWLHAEEVGGSRVINHRFIAEE